MAESSLLYYITDRTAFAPDELTSRSRLLEKIAEAARANIDYIQLREKDLSVRELESLARDAVRIVGKLRNESREVRTRLLVNSRTDIALSVHADGVHLRSDDISPEEVHTIWRKSCVGTAAVTADKAHALKEKPLIGISCHTPEEVSAAKANGATFAVFAPVFEKKDAPDTHPAGLAQLHEACKIHMPVLALGGITLANARSCLQAGAAGIAAIRLFQENDIAEIVDSVQHAFTRY